MQDTRQHASTTSMADARRCPAPVRTTLTRTTGIEDLKEKREQILKQIQDEESEKAKISQELQALTQRLARVNGAWCCCCAAQARVR
jgi:hypothetical protein